MSRLSVRFRRVAFFLAIKTRPVTATQDSNSPSTRQLFSLAYFWSILRAPETFVFSLILMAGALALAGLIPQQPVSVAGDDYAQWVETIPNPYRQLATPLNAAGLFRIYATFWFWVPAAFLVLVCLIALADYAPLVGRYIIGRSSPSPPAQPHPFYEQTSTTHSIPSPSDAGKSAASSTPLLHAQRTLSDANYRTYPDEAGQVLTATRHHRRWAGPIALAAGLILTVTGLIVQTLWGAGQGAELSIRPGGSAFLASQPVRVRAFNPRRDAFNQLAGGTVVLDIGDQTNLPWRLHRPYRLGGWWFVPAGIRPSAEITLAQTGSPPETIAPHFPAARKPAYFSSPAEGLLFKLTYVPTAAGPDYRLTLIESPDSSAGGAEVVREGAQFFAPAYNMNGAVTIDERLQLRAYRLPGLGFVLAGLATLLFGLIWLALEPPATMWLALITRGRGSRIEVETLSLRLAPPRLKQPQSPISLPAPEDLYD